MGDKATYVLLFGAGSALALLKSLLVASSLGPVGFGQYSLLLISAAVLSYASSIGIFEAFLIRLNRRRSGNDERRDYRDSGIVASASLSLLIAAATSAGLLMSGSGLSPATVILVGCFLVANNLLNGLMVEVQADQHPVEYAACLTAKSALPVALLVAGIATSLNDVVTFELLSLALIVGYLLYRRGMPSVRRFSRTRVAVLVKEGAPFAANAASLNVANNLDRWAIGLAAGPALLGLYAFGAQLATIGMAFASMVQIYMYPRIIAQTLPQAPSSSLMRRALSLAAVSGALCGSAILLTVAAGAVLVPQWFPEYRAALPILPVLAVGAIAIGANHSEIVFRVVGRGREYFIIQLAALVATAIAFGVLILVRAPLMYFAVCFTLGRVGQAVAGYAYASVLVRRHSLAGAI